MERFRIVERELRRISKIIRNPDYNPIDIFALETPFSDEELKKQYHKIIRLIHPDKNGNIKHFCETFDTVNKAYKILTDKEKKSLCIEFKKTCSQSLLKKIFETEKDEPWESAKDQTQSKELRIIKWDPSALNVIKNSVQKEQIKVTVNIAKDGAEHTTHKCKSKSDKHQKGLQQRATQKKNAEKRIKNHKFSFTDKVSMEIVPEKQKNNFLNDYLNNYL